MSFPVWNSDPSWNKITSSYFKDTIDLSGNFIIRNGTIKSPSNTIEFDDVYYFTNFLNNVNIYGQQKLTYNSVVYDVGLQCEKTDTLVSDVATLSPIVSDTQFKTTGLYWDAGLSSTVFTDNVSFPNGSISSLAINNSSFVALSGAQTIDGIKTFNSAPVMSGASITNLSIPVGKITGTAVALSGTQTITATKTFSVAQTFQNNIRLDGSLLVNNGTTTLTNAQLQNIADIGTLKTITTAINYTPATTTTVISNILQFTGTLNSWSTTNFSNAINYAKDLTSSAQAQINTLTTNSVSLSASNIFTGATNQFSNSIRLDGTLVLNANTLTLTNANLQKIQYLSTVSSDVQTQINTLTTNSVSLSASNVFSGATNQFSNSIRLDGTLVLNANTLTLTNANLQKIQYLSTVSSDVQTQITALGTRATTLETKTTKMSYTSVGGINTTTILDGLISQTLSFTNTLNNISTTVFGYISGLTSSAQTQLTNLSYSVNPVASIIMSPMSDIQTTSGNKYLLCDGQSVGRSSYPNLFAKIGTTFGSADPFSFNVPNYQGAFLRGYGQQIVSGQIYEGNYTVNTAQQDAIQEHKHWGQAGSYCGTNRVSQASNAFANGGFFPGTYNFDQTGLQSSGRSDAGETRPMNYCVFYYIKS